MDGMPLTDAMTDREIQVEILTRLRSIGTLLEKYEPLLESVSTKRDGFVGRMVFGGR